MRQMIVRGSGQIQALADQLRSLDPSKAWRVEIARHSERRTVSQNKLLWAIYTAIADTTGHTTDEIHTYCKAKLLPKRIVSFDNEDHEIMGSTAELDRPAFAQYVERVAAWASSEFGIVV